MRVMLTIARREFVGYFITPLAYVFLVVFLVAAAVATFYFGRFLEDRQADLIPFFQFHPFLLLVLMPAVGMRLWTEERRSGSIELLMTLPVTTWQAVLGKFLAAWAFAGICLILTFPIVWTVNWLGSPDNGVIAAGYVGSFLMAGALIALTSCISALTKSQVIAFVISVVAGFILMVSGLALVLDLFTGWAPEYLVDLVASFSFYTHFNELTSGIIAGSSIVFFVSLIGLLLLINRQIIELKKAG
ncbi:MAG: ABC transporter permease subunit [Bauldia sp.]|nr:ABC transporter permease subunit [Bauldia sp.]MCW5718353.1 ABC transporter permease subunit [Bauldia sp.]